MAGRFASYNLRMAACVVLILALAVRLNQALGTIPRCNQDFLFAVSQENNGVGLSLIFNSSSSSYTSTADAQSHKQVTLQEQLSSQCGDDFFRCKDPLTLTTKIDATTLQYIFFVPLENSLLLQEVVQNSASVKLGKRYLLSTTSSILQYSCSPIKAFEIAYDYYLVCSDIERNYISFHRIFLNKTSLQQTTLSITPIAKFHTPEDMQTLSNPVYVEEELVIKMILFSVGNSMYVFDILAFGGEEYGYVGNNCTHVKDLQYTGNYQLLAYCDFTNVYYSVEYENWRFEYWNDDDGIPYPCSNTSILLRVFTAANYLHYSINNLVGNTNLLGDGFRNGVCFGAAKQQTVFAYSDLSVVYMMNMETFDNVEVLKSSCTAPGCLSINVVDDRFLVIREDSNTDRNMYIFDTKGNLTNLITEKHFTSALFKFVSDVPLVCVTVNDTVVVGPTLPTFNLDDSSVNVVGAVLGTLTAVVVVLALVGFSVFASIKYHRSRVRISRRESPALTRIMQVDDDDAGSVLTVCSSLKSVTSKVVYPPQLSLPGVQVNNNNANTSPLSATNTTASQERVGNVDSDPHQMSAIHQGNDSPLPNNSPSLAFGQGGASNWTISGGTPKFLEGNATRRADQPMKLELFESIPDNEKRDDLSESISCSTPGDCDDKTLLLP